MSGQRLYRPDEACRVLSIGRSLLFELIAKGDLETVLIGSRARRITAEAIDSYVDRLRAATGRSP